MKRKLSVFISFFIFFFGLGGVVFAEEGDTSIPQLGIILQPKNSGVQVAEKCSGELVETIVKNIFTLFFTVAAVAFVIMILWGATEWILSGGDKEKIASARKRITTAIIGIVILALAFVIVDLVGQVVGINFAESLIIPAFVGDPARC